METEHGTMETACKLSSSRAWKLMETEHGSMQICSSRAWKLMETEHGNMEIACKFQVAEHGNSWKQSMETWKPHGRPPVAEQQHPRSAYNQARRVVTACKKARRVVTACNKARRVASCTPAVLPAKHKECYSISIADAEPEMCLA